MGYIVLGVEDTGYGHKVVASLLPGCFAAPTRLKVLTNFPPPNRDVVDKYIVYAGMFVTVVVIWILYRWL